MKYVITGTQISMHLDLYFGNALNDVLQSINVFQVYSFLSTTFFIKLFSENKTFYNII